MSTPMQRLQAHLSGPVNWPGLTSLVAEATWEECDCAESLTYKYSCPRCQGTGRADAHLTLRLALVLARACRNKWWKEKGQFNPPKPWDRRAEVIDAAEHWLQGPSRERHEVWVTAWTKAALDSRAWKWLPRPGDKAVVWQCRVEFCGKILGSERAWALLSKKVA